MARTITAMARKATAMEWMGGELLFMKVLKYRPAEIMA